MTAVLVGAGALHNAVGLAYGPTDWIAVGAAECDLFLLAAPDPSLPPGVIPPLLVLSFTNLFLPRLFTVRGFSAGVNYGTGRVRFPAMVPMDTNLRARAEIGTAEDLPGGVQVSTTITVEAEGHAKPACVVDSLSRFMN